MDVGHFKPQVFPHRIPDEGIYLILYNPYKYTLSDILINPNTELHGGFADMIDYEEKQEKISVSILYPYQAYDKVYKLNIDKDFGEENFFIRWRYGYYNLKVKWKRDVKVHFTLEYTDENDKPFYFNNLKNFEV